MCLPSPLAVILACTLLAIPAWSIDFQGANPINEGVADGTFDRNVRVATDRAGNWVAVYERLVQGGSFQYDIVAITSDDNGKTWSDPEFVNSNSGDSRDDTVPQIATDGDGNWVCVWKGAHDEMGHYGIYTAVSTDTGATWSDRVELDYTSFNNVDVNYPSVASDGAGNWIIAWQTYEPIEIPDKGFSDLHIAYAVSANGSTWSAKQALSSDGPSNHSPHVMSDRDGTWICAWVSTFDFGIEGNDDPKTVFSRSINEGTTWSTQAAVNGDFNTERKIETSPRLAADGDGNWVIVWDGYYKEGDRYDIYSAYSDDDGATWSNKKTISTIPPKSDDDVDADIATDRNGRWVVVWGRAGSANYELYKSESLDNGATWTAPNDAGLVADNNNTLNDNNASIATDEDGKWVVLWHTDGGGQLDIWRAISGPPYPGSLTLVSPNGGEKWKLGKRATIQWNSTGNPGGKVRLEFFSGNSFVTTIKASTDNDGEFRWRVPEQYPVGKYYFVRIYSTKNFNIRDRSNKEFSLKAPN